MNLILFLFIFPIATIIFSIALQKIFRNPFLVSAIILAVFLIVTFTVYGVNFLILAIIYSVLALITAWIVSVFERLANRTIQINLIENDNNNCNDDNNNCDNKCDDNLDTEACRICNCQRQFRRCLRGR